MIALLYAVIIYKRWSLTHQMSASKGAFKISDLNSKSNLTEIKSCWTAERPDEHSEVLADLVPSTMSSLLSSCCTETDHCTCMSTTAYTIHC